MEPAMKEEVDKRIRKETPAATPTSKKAYVQILEDIAAKDHHPTKDAEEW